MSYIQDDLKKMNYVIVMFTDLANLYRDNKIEAGTCADYFVTLMSTIFGQQNLEQASESLGEILKLHGVNPNFYVESIHGKKKKK